MDETATDTPAAPANNSTPWQPPISKLLAVRHADWAQVDPATDARAEQAASELQRKQRQGLARSIIEQAGSRYAGATLENFQVHHPGQQQILDRLKAFRAELPE